MRPTEIHKHHARIQVLKVIEHLREARQKLNYADRHLPFINGVPECEKVFVDFKDALTKLYQHLDEVFNNGINLTHILKELMENSDEKPPPIEGHFLSYSDRTPLQRHLIREGYEAIAQTSRERIPTHYYTEPAPLKPAKILTDLDKRKPKPNRRKLNPDMPL